jgi:hypothetical protein
MSHNSLRKPPNTSRIGPGALVTLTITNASPRSRRNIDCGRKFSANLTSRPARLARNQPPAARLSQRDCRPTSSESPATSLMDASCYVLSS